MAEPTKRIVLLGKTGSGKSSLGNTIFGEEVFASHYTSKSGTSECKAETRSVHGRSIMLIDTPGFFDKKRSADDLKAEIVNCIAECAPGPHAFLILLKVERLSELEETIIKKAEEYFSEDVYKYAKVVFTHGDQLQVGQTIEDFLSEDQSLMKKFAGGCHVIDNKYWNNENSGDEYRSNKFQVEKLLKSVDEMIKINKGGYFTNEMFQKVREEIQKLAELLVSIGNNISNEDIEKMSKQIVVNNLLELFAGTSTGVLLGALMGEKIMVKTAMKLLKSWKVAKEEIKALAAVAGLTVVGGATEGRAAFGRGIALTVVGMSAAVGGVAGGFAGYCAAKDAKTPLEAMEKAANTVTEGADSVSDKIEKNLMN